EAFILLRRQRRGAAVGELEGLLLIEHHRTVFLLAEGFALTKTEEAGDWRLRTRQIPCVDLGEGEPGELFPIEGIRAAELDAILHSQILRSAERGKRCFDHAFAALLVGFRAGCARQDQKRYDFPHQRLLKSASVIPVLTFRSWIITSENFFPDWEIV